MPRHKPVDGPGYNPNMTDIQFEEWRRATYKRGYEAGQSGRDQKAVEREIQEGGVRGHYLREGYVAGRRRNPATRPETRQEEDLRDRKRLVRRQGQYINPFYQERK